MAKSWHGGHLWAAWRQGLREIREVAAMPFPDSIAKEEPGGIGNPTQVEITRSRDAIERQDPEPER